MDFDIVVSKLRSKVDNANNIKNDIDTIKDSILFFQNRLIEDDDDDNDDDWNDYSHTYYNRLFYEITKNFRNTRSLFMTNIEKCQLLQYIRDKKTFNMWKKIRSLYLFLNKNKKFIFGFNNKLWNIKRNFWKTCQHKKIHLLIQIDDHINDGIFPDYKLEYLKLLRKNINDYRSDYGLTIGLVLNRLFYKDIVFVIFQYL